MKKTSPRLVNTVTPALEPAQVKRMLQAIDDGTSQRDIAQRFRVSIGYVVAVCEGRQRRAVGQRW